MKKYLKFLRGTKITTKKLTTDVHSGNLEMVRNLLAYQ